MLALYQAADVVLDTYPAGSYITSLQVGFLRCSPLLVKTRRLFVFHSSASQVAFRDTLPFLGGMVVLRPCPEKKSRYHSRKCCRLCRLENTLNLTHSRNMHGIPPCACFELTRVEVGKSELPFYEDNLIHAQGWGTGEQRIYHRFRPQRRVSV